MMQRLKDGFSPSTKTWRPLTKIPGQALVRYLVTAFSSFIVLFTLYRFIGAGPPNKSYFYAQQSTSSSRHAFATLLAPYVRDGSSENDIAQDSYFLATRVLLYQIRHSTATAYHDPTIPFLVLVLPGVEENKKLILQAEGATILAVDLLLSDWMQPNRQRWVAVLSKIYLWSFNVYEKILFMDSDMLLTQSLDGIFNDPAAQPTTSNSPLFEQPKHNITCHLPNNYVMGGVLDGASGSRQKPFSTTCMNAGFFLIQPDLLIFDCMMQFIITKDSYPPGMPEQNLMNHIFQKDGAMPWQQLTATWDTSCPEKDDIKNGYKSVHGKWWSVKVDSCPIDPWIGRFWFRVLGQMECFYNTNPHLTYIES